MEEAADRAPQDQPGLREQVESVVERLAKRGEVRTKDIQKAAREIADRSTRDRSELVRLIQKEIRRQINARRPAASDGSLQPQDDS